MQQDASCPTCRRALSAAAEGARAPRPPRAPLAPLAPLPQLAPLAPLAPNANRPNHFFHFDGECILINEHQRQSADVTEIPLEPTTLYLEVYFIDVVRCSLCTFVAFVLFFEDHVSVYNHV